MKLTHVKKGFTFHELFIPNNAVVYTDNIGNIYVCMNFPKYYAGNNPALNIYVYDIDFQCWELQKAMKNFITKSIWAYYIKGGHKKMRYDNNVDYANMMKHSRVHKKGSGIKRERINTVTDYECTKNALNDFPRVYCFNISGTKSEAFQRKPYCYN